VSGSGADEEQHRLLVNEVTAFEPLAEALVRLHPAQHAVRVH
jgi:hypothetical protein